MKLKNTWKNPDFSARWRVFRTPLGLSEPVWGGGNPGLGSLRGLGLKLGGKSRRKTRWLEALEHSQPNKVENPFFFLTDWDGSRWLDSNHSTSLVFLRVRLTTIHVLSKRKEKAVDLFSYQSLSTRQQKIPPLLDWSCSLSSYRKYFWSFLCAWRGP